MRLNILVLLLSITPFAISQKTKRIIIDDYELFCKHEYHVLKKDKSIRHGPYKSTWVSGNPRVEGYYSFGKKDSLWTYFNRFRPIIASRGQYENDNKVGVWEYFDDKEQIMNRYDHSKKYLSYTTYRDTVLQRTVRLKDTTFDVKLQRPPIYLLGEAEKFRVIQENIIYPKSAIEQNIFGTVMISFYINKDGEAIEHQISKRIGGGCDEEALRVVKMIPNEWIPGIYQNEETEVQIVMPITFMLN